MQLIRVYAFVKKILKRYSHQPVNQIHLDNRINEKPFMRCDHSHPPFFFSYSYRNDYCILVISNEPAVGVDVEEVTAIDNPEIFLFTHFSKNEQRKILTAPNEQDRLLLLYRLWTMKEAFVKALSVGLSEDLKKYDLSDFLDKPAGVMKFGPPIYWRIETMPVGEKYMAAIAVKAKQVSLKLFEYLL